MIRIRREEVSRARVCWSLDGSVNQEGASTSDGSALCLYAERRKFDPHAACLFCSPPDITYVQFSCALARRCLVARLPYVSNFISDAR